MAALREAYEDQFCEMTQVEDEEVSVLLPYKLSLINDTQLCEIRAYTANELFRVQSRTDQLYKEFDKIREMKQALKNTVLSDLREQPYE